MAVSEKYSKFSKKRPHRGLLGKTISSNAKQWALYEACDLVTPATPAYGYTAMDVTTLTAGVDIYADEALTQPLHYSEFSVTYYFYDATINNSASFTIYGDTSTIYDYAECYLGWGGFTDCELSIPVYVYTKYLYNGSPGITLTSGMVLYTNYAGILDTPYSYASFISYDNTSGWYVNPANGVLGETGVCSV